MSDRVKTPLSDANIPFQVVLFAKFSMVKPPSITRFSYEKECFSK